MHRLRCVRRGLPGRRHHARGPGAYRVAGVHRAQRRLLQGPSGVSKRSTRPVRSAAEPSPKDVMTPSPTVIAEPQDGRVVSPEAFIPLHARRTMERVIEDRNGVSPEQEARAWIASLRAAGPERAQAIGRLHGLLLRAARFELSRRQAALSHVRGEELDDLATQAADDALMAILSKLDTYRGASRFTTWAYKFALLEAGVKLRRRAWQGREVVLEPEAWPAFGDERASAQDVLEQGELLAALKTAINEGLTSHQRDVFVALALNQVPIDVLADR